MLDMSCPQRWQIITPAPIGSARRAAQLKQCQLAIGDSDQHGGCPCESGRVCPFWREIKVDNMTEKMSPDVFAALESYPRGSSAFIDDHSYCDITEATEALDCINLWQWCDCVGDGSIPSPDCPTCMGWGGGYACMVHDFPVSATMAEREAAFASGHSADDPPIRADAVSARLRLTMEDQT